jgi:WD40 repeat protein
MGMGLLHGVGALLLAPAILPSKAEASPQVAQDGPTTRGNVFGQRLRHRQLVRANANIFTHRVNKKNSLVAYSEVPGGYITVIDLRTNAVVRHLVRQSMPFRLSFDFIGDGEHLVSTPINFTVGSFRATSLGDIVHLGTGQIVEQIPIPDGVDQIPLPRDMTSTRLHVHGILASEDSEYVTSHFSVNLFTTFVCVYDRKNRNIVHQFSVNERSARFSEVMSFHSKSGIVIVYNLSGRRDGDSPPVYIYDLGSGALRALLAGNRPSISAIAWSADGALLATAGDMKQETPINGAPFQEEDAVWIWDVASSRVVRKLQALRHSIWCMAFSHNGDFLAAVHGRADGRLGRVLVVWNLRNGAMTVVKETSGEVGIEDVRWVAERNALTYVDGKGVFLVDGFVT